MYVYLDCASDDAEGRAQFLRAVRYFSGIAHQAWGTLLTPLVNGMRVAGPFAPKWADHPSGLVLIDTEGLGHKASATADVSDDLLALIYEAQAIVLVDSAKTGTTITAGKALGGRRQRRPNKEARGGLHTHGRHGRQPTRTGK